MGSAIILDHESIKIDSNYIGSFSTATAIDFKNHLLGNGNFSLNLNDLIKQNNFLKNELPKLEKFEFTCNEWIINFYSYRYYINEKYYLNGTGNFYAIKK